jgi:hypothetical protein
MKPKIAIPLGVAGILAAIGTTIANANGLFAGHPSLAYWFWAASLVMIAIAVAGWIFGSDASSFHSSERAKEPAPPTLPSQVTVHQENKQEFKPTINFGIADRERDTEKEHNRQEQIISEYLREQNEWRPSMTHPVGDVALKVNLTFYDADQALKKLYAKDMVYRSPIDVDGDFVYWYRGSSSKQQLGLHEKTRAPDFPDKIRLFSKDLAAYLSNRMARPDEEEIWRKYGSSSSTTSSARLFAEKYNETVQAWDDRLAAGYWLEYAEKAAALRHELVLRRGADAELDDLLSGLEGPAKGEHHLLMQRLIERFRLLASKLD